LPPRALPPDERPKKTRPPKRARKFKTGAGYFSFSSTSNKRHWVADLAVTRTTCAINRGGSSGRQKITNDRY
jgi:hypothetical protein